VRAVPPSTASPPGDAVFRRRPLWTGCYAVGAAGVLLPFGGRAPGPLELAIAALLAGVVVWRVRRPFAALRSAALRLTPAAWETREIPWSELRSFARTGDDLVLRTAGGGELRVSLFDLAPEDRQRFAAALEQRGLAREAVEASPDAERARRGRQRRGRLALALLAALVYVAWRSISSS
jgi:hypothetical protein